MSVDQLRIVKGLQMSDPRCQIEIEIYMNQESHPFTLRYWPAVPRVGERVELSGGTARVIDVFWRASRPDAAVDIPQVALRVELEP